MTCKPVPPALISLGATYVAAAQPGEQFTGPAGPYYFRQGVADGGPLSGAIIRSRGGINFLILFEYREGHALRWDREDRQWYYEPVPQAPELPFSTSAELRAMLVPELKDLCAEHQVVPESAKKADLVAALAALLD